MVDAEGAGGTFAVKVPAINKHLKNIFVSGGVKLAMVGWVTPVPGKSFRTRRITTGTTCPTVAAPTQGLRFCE